MAFYMISSVPFSTIYYTFLQQTRCPSIHSITSLFSISTSLSWYRKGCQLNGKYPSRLICSESIVERMQVYFCVLFYKAFCYNSYLWTRIQIVILLLPLPVDSYYTWQRCHIRVAKGQVQIQRSHPESPSKQAKTDAFKHVNIARKESTSDEKNSWLWQQMKTLHFCKIVKQRHPTCTSTLC